MRAGQRLSSMFSASQKLLEQADLVVDIEHGEIGFELHQFGMGAQDTATDRMKGAEPRHALDLLAEHLAKAQFISRALLVKVTERISPGRGGPGSGYGRSEQVSTRVLPVPAPASTRTGPSSARSTA